MYEYLHPVHVSVALVCIPLYIERFNINDMIDEYFRSILCTGQHIEVRILMLQLHTHILIQRCHLICPQLYVSI